MNDVVIESGIKMPESRSRYPWEKLKVGESFKVNNAANAHALASNASKTHAPKKFLGRKEKNSGRIWRVK